MNFDYDIYIKTFLVGFGIMCLIGMYISKDVTTQLMFFTLLVASVWMLADFLRKKIRSDKNGRRNN